MKSSGNPYLERIASLVGETNPRYVLRAFVASHRGASESLEAMARRLGVSRIIDERLPFEGGLFKLPDGELVIKLNRESPLVRKRFTLAHEIGHLLLKTVPAFRGSHHGEESLERTCDSIAAELLMPSDDATDFVRGIGSPSSENLKKIASEYGVSLHAAALRLHYDLKLWSCAIGMWGLLPRIKTLWFVGPRRWDGTLPDSFLLERANSPGASVRANDLWRSRERTENVLLDLLGLGNSRVVGLVGYAK